MHLGTRKQARGNRQDSDIQQFIILFRSHVHSPNTKYSLREDLSRNGTGSVASNGVGDFARYQDASISDCLEEQKNHGEEIEDAGTGHDSPQDGMRPGRCRAARKESKQSDNGKEEMCALMFRTG